MIGDKFKFVRKSNNLSMDKLARIFNNSFNKKYSKSMISSWENGRYTPSLDTLENYSALFEISTDYFVNNDIPVNDFYKFHYPIEIKEGDFFENNLNPTELHELYLRIIENNIKELSTRSLKKISEYTSDLMLVESHEKLINIENKKD